MRYLIETYGCQLNMAESNAIELLLKGQGAEKTEDAERAVNLFLLHAHLLSKTHLYSLMTSPFL